MVHVLYPEIGPQSITECFLPTVEGLTMITDFKFDSDDQIRMPVGGESFRECLYPPMSSFPIKILSYL